MDIVNIITRFSPKNIKVNKRRKEILSEVLEIYLKTGSFPEENKFKLSHKNDLDLIDDLMYGKKLARLKNHPREIELTLHTLFYLQNESSKDLLKTGNALILVLNELYESDGGMERFHLISDIAEKVGRDLDYIYKTLYFLEWTGVNGGSHTGKDDMKIGSGIIQLTTLEEFFKKSESRDRKYYTRPFLFKLESWLKDYSMSVTLLLTLINLATVIYNSFFKT